MVGSFAASHAAADAAAAADVKATGEMELLDHRLANCPMERVPRRHIVEREDKRYAADSLE